MEGFGIREVANLLGVTVPRVTRWVRRGLVAPQRAQDGSYRFQFRDVVLLRRAKELQEQDVPLSRVRLVLQALRGQLPSDRPLSSVSIQVWGEQLVVSDPEGRWEPESGQAVFDFDAAQVAPIRSLPELATPDEKTEGDLSADEWFELALDAEGRSLDAAREALRRCLELDPEHHEARISIGRVMLDLGRFDAAEAHFRLAQTLLPNEPVGSFHLALALEALERSDEALQFYEAAVRLDPRFEDAYVALARLQERVGDEQGALRTLSALRRLRDDPS